VDSVRLISWNVNGRTGGACSRQVDAILDRDPDLIGLQEVTAATDPQWRSRLTEAGYAVLSSVALLSRPYADPSIRRWERAELGILVGLATFGLRDVFRGFHGYAAQPASWTKGIAERRYDHIFASNDMATISCDYIHDWRVFGLSDHSAIEAVLQPENLNRDTR